MVVCEDVAPATVCECHCAELGLSPDPAVLYRLSIRWSGASVVVRLYGLPKTKHEPYTCAVVVTAIWTNAKHSFVKYTRTETSLSLWP